MRREKIERESRPGFPVPNRSGDFGLRYDHPYPADFVRPDFGRLAIPKRLLRLAKPRLAFWEIESALINRIGGADALRCGAQLLAANNEVIGPLVEDCVAGSGT